MADLPTIEMLHRLLRYEPETGLLFWRERSPDLFRATPGRSSEHACANWNARYSEREAFLTSNGEGYRVGRIFGQRLLAHRVIWALTHGAWPCDEVDHRDLDRANNRIQNLRVATSGQNKCNTPARRSGTSGCKGVTWNARRGKWMAQIAVKGRNKYLGLFDEKSGAAAAYAAASMSAHGEFARAS